MDIGKYPALKLKGSVSLQRLGPQTFQMVVKKYDPDTGKEMVPEIVSMNAEWLTATRAQIQKDIEQRQQGIAGIDAVLVDMKTLDDTAAAA